MQTDNLLDLIPLWCFVPLVCCSFWLALDGGYRFGNWRRTHHPGEREQPVAAITGSIIGLLALVLGFTFSFAANRFETRRRIVLDEANAIGTTYLRSRMLPQPQSEAVAELLREYAQVRLQAVQGGDIELAVARSKELHELLWQQAMQTGQLRDTPLTSLFVQSLNELIDLHAERMLYGLRSRIPIVTWALLLFLGHLSFVAVGYQSALMDTNRSPVMWGLVLAFVSVLYLIADLDRVQEGLLRVGQQAILEVLQDMQPMQP